LLFVRYLLCELDGEEEEDDEDDEEDAASHRRSTLFTRLDRLDEALISFDFTADSASSVILNNEEIELLDNS
jgi:hypothetical protein